MPKNQFERAIFALLTVIVTVHAYVFYSIYIIHGSTFISNVPGCTGVIDAVSKMGGVPMFGTNLPIWAVVLVEFVCAYTLEIFVGSPCSFKLAGKVFHPGDTHPVVFETAVISATVAIMCPAMSFLAALFYYPYTYQPFNIFTILANWLQLVCYNFAFAFFSQLFFIQPLIRTIFKRMFRKVEKVDCKGKKQ